MVSSLLFFLWLNWIFFFEEIIFVELSVLLFAEADQRLCPDKPGRSSQVLEEEGFGH